MRRRDAVPRLSLSGETRTECRRRWRATELRGGGRQLGQNSGEDSEHDFELIAFARRLHDPEGADFEMNRWGRNRPPRKIWRAGTLATGAVLLATGTDAFSGDILEDLLRRWGEGNSESHGIRRGPSFGQYLAGSPRRQDLRCADSHEVLRSPYLGDACRFLEEDQGERFSRFRCARCVGCLRFLWSQFVGNDYLSEGTRAFSVREISAADDQARGFVDRAPMPALIGGDAVGRQIGAPWPHGRPQRGSSCVGEVSSTETVALLIRLIRFSFVTLVFTSRRVLAARDWADQRAGSKFHFFGGRPRERSRTS